MDLVVGGFYFRGGLYPFRLEGMVVWAVVSCLGRIAAVGMNIEGSGSGDWLKRWLNGQNGPVLVV